MKTKRLLNIVLTLAMLLGALPGIALADSPTITITPGTDAAKTGTGTMTITLTIAPATVDVTGVTLDKTTAQTIDVDGTVSFTASIEPAGATDKTVVWTVGGTDAGAVKLYSDEACKTEVGAEATATLTVYAKGISAGTATVTATSNADSQKSASCAVTVTDPLADAKTSAKADLDTLLTEKNQNDYDAADWTTLTQAITDGKTAIDNATTSDAVTTAKNNAVDAVNAVKTKAQKALENAKTTAKNDLDTLQSGKNQNDYDAADWTTLTQAITDGKTAIDNATTSDAVTTAKNNAVDAVNAVKTKAQKLADAKTEAKNDLDTLKNSKTESDYDAADWTTLTQAITDGKTAIDNATTSDAVTTAKNNAVDAVNAVKTKAQKLADAKTEAKNDLDTLKNSKTESDYDAADWTTLTQAITDGKTAIDNATTSDAVTTAKNNAVDAVNAVKTKAQKLADAKTEAKNDLDTLKNSKTESDYDAADWTTLTQAITDGKTAIDNATTSDAVTTAKNNAVDAVNAVKTKAQKLADAKTEAKNDLDTLKNSKTESDYDAADWTTLTQAITDGKTAIDNATTSDAVTTAKNNAVDAVNAVKTKAQKLADAKTEAKNDLDTLKNSKTESDYDAADWTTLTQAITDGKTAIDNATTSDAVTTAKNNAVDAVNAVKTKAQKLADAKTEAKNDLDTLKNSKTESDYDAADWTTLTQAITDGKTAIDNATTSDAVTTAKNNAVDAVNAVKTKAQKLADAKTEAKNDLDTLKNSKTESDYDAADWTTLTQAITDGKTAIDNATTSDAVTTAKNNAVDAVNAVKTKAQKALENAKTTAKNTVNAVNANDYIAADQQTVTDAKTTALAAIEAATTEEEVTTALNNFNNAIASCTTQVVANQIAQVMSEVSAKTGSDMTYTGSPIQLINTPTTALPAGYTMKYAVTTENVKPTDESLYTTEIPTATNAGTYYVWYKAVAKDDNYVGSTPVCVEVTINAAQSDGSSTAKPLTYDGNAQALVVPGEVIGGKLFYALGVDNVTAPVDGWSETVPTAAEPGTYYVWYKVEGDENHNSTAPACVVVTIEKPINPAEYSDFTLLASLKTSGKKALKLSWTAVEGAEGYDVFFGSSSASAAPYLTTVTGNEYTVNKLKNGRGYRANVQAWRTVNGNKVYIGQPSPDAFAITGGKTKKFTNPKKITVNKKKRNVTLAVGKTAKIKAKVTKVASGKRFLKQVAKIRYFSSDRRVATVDAKGNVTAVGAGTCQVFAVAANGLRVGVNVTVK